jgi:tight adherence protein C
MPFYVYLGALSIAGSVILLWWGFSGPTTARVVRDNLAQGTDLRADYREMDLSRSLNERLFQPIVRVLGRRGRRLTTGGVVDATNRRIQLAGLADSWSVERVLAAKVGLLSLAIVVGVLRVTTTDVSRIVIGEIILLAVAAYLAPDAIMSRKAAERQAQIERELPDTIDQITVSVEAGLGFDAALARAARTGRGVFAAELMRVLQDIQVGLSRDAALDRLLLRTDVADLRHVVLAIRQSERYGLPIANILRIQASELREKRRARAEERAMQIPVKIVFPLVFCILPALFVVVLGPAALQIQDQF